MHHIMTDADMFHMSFLIILNVNLEGNVPRNGASCARAVIYFAVKLYLKVKVECVT